MEYPKHRRGEGHPRQIIEHPHKGGNPALGQLHPVRPNLCPVVGFQIVVSFDDLLVLRLRMEIVLRGVHQTHGVHHPAEVAVAVGAEPGYIQHQHHKNQAQERHPSGESLGILPDGVRFDFALRQPGRCPEGLIGLRRKNRLRSLSGTQRGIDQGMEEAGDSQPQQGQKIHKLPVEEKLKAHPASLPLGKAAAQNDRQQPKPAAQRQQQPGKSPAAFLFQAGPQPHQAAEH